MTASANWHDQQPARTQGRWTRVPLVGDMAGIMLLLPDEPLSPENWDQFMRCLEAMRPGLVAEPKPTDNAEEDTVTVEDVQDPIVDEDPEDVRGMSRGTTVFVLLALGFVLSVVFEATP